MSLASRKITVYADKAVLGTVTVSVPAKKLDTMPAVARAALAELCATHGATVTRATLCDPSNRLGKEYPLTLPELATTI